MDKYFVFDPTNGIYYKNSLEELCSNPSKADNKIYQINEKDVIDVYASVNFWSGVYSIRAYNHVVQREDRQYNSGYFKNISYSINDVLISSEKCDMALLLDNNPQSKVKVPVNQSDIIEIEINLDGEENIGVLVLDFLEMDRALKNLKLYCYDKSEDRFILFKVEEEKISSEYEFFLEGIKTNKLKIVGESVCSDMGEICLNEIILLESIERLDIAK